MKIAASLIVATMVAASLLYWSSSRLDDGVVAFKTQRYEEAVQILTPLTWIGNDTAQKTLGFAYAYGLGVEADEKKARRLIEASVHSPETIYSEIAQIYRAGSVDVEPDSEMANYWTNLALKDR